MDEVLPAQRRLPVWATFRRSYGYVWEYRALFAAPILIVFVATLAGNLVVGAIMPAPDDLAATQPGAAAIVVSALFRIAIGILGMSVAVGVHRTVLLDEVRSGFAFLRGDRHLWSYFKTTVLLLLIYLLLLLGLAAIVGIVGFAVAAFTQGTGMDMPAAARIGFALLVAGMVAVGALVFLRLALALPAAALGDGRWLELSWRATRHNALRLFAASALVFLPWAATILLVELAVVSAFAGFTFETEAMPPGLRLLTLVVQAAASAIAVPVFTVMLSLSYDVLVRGGGPQRARPGAEGVTPP